VEIFKAAWTVQLFEVFARFFCIVIRMANKFWGTVEETNTIVLIRTYDCTKDSIDAYNGD
jgi:hypothetical protein